MGNPSLNRTVVFPDKIVSRRKDKNMKFKLGVTLAAIMSLFCWRAASQTYDTNGDYVQTFAGSGEQGDLDGQGLLTKFSNPSQIVSDTASNLYVWDSGNNLIRKITPNGVVSTFAGGGTDFEGFGTNVSFANYSFGQIAIDHFNTIWVVASFGGNNFLLNIKDNGYVSIQNGGSGLTNLSTSSGICFDSANNLYYGGGNIIYRYNPTTGLAYPFAGNGTSGYRDGNGTVFPEFSFGSSPALASDQANNIYVWDFDPGNWWGSGNCRIRRVDPSQNITTIAGNGSYGNLDGVGTNAGFSSISQMFSDNLGNIYFACGTCIRRMDAQTNVVTLAGNFSQNGYADGAGNLALFNSANGACLSQGMIFVADSANQVIRNITFNPTPQVLSPANLQLNIYPGLQITGSVGRTYQIQTSPDLNSWSIKTNLLLTSSPYLWIDQNSVSGNKFYRAVMLP
jgi:hypothetical protein